MNNLENINVLVTRPNPQGKILCEKIQMLGGATVYLPTIEFASPIQEIKPISNVYDWIIFISPEAVLRSIHLITPLPEKTRVASIGEGTANALHKANIAKVVYPEQNWTSEGLLDLAFFKNVHQQKILLVRGEDGREILAETLVDRGALVDHLPVYRRVVPDYPNRSEYTELLVKKKIDIVVCTSGESLHNLMTILGAENQSLLIDLAIIVVSSRLVEIAKQYHFARIFQAKNASHQAIIDTLCFIKGKDYVR